MSDITNIDRYITFIKTLPCESILLNVMQDPATLKDPKILQEHFTELFKAFSPYVQQFQIGTTINRSKWGFFSVGQYLKFYQVAYKVKQQDYPSIKLLGPSVIDFEYHYAIHALFNLFSLRYDALSALLYVDRRGAPENTQMGMDLISKIHLLYGLATLSPKSTNEVIITETNWPLSGTAPYAPTSEYECIDEETYANYLVRYYLLALCSNMVKSVYWHQLIAPGYGLIDNRDGRLIKRPGFHAYKTMLDQLQDAVILSFIQHKKFYEVLAQKENELIRVLWCNGSSFTLRFETETCLVLRDGKTITADRIELSDSLVYCKEPL